MLSKQTSLSLCRFLALILALSCMVAALGNGAGAQQVVRLTPDEATAIAQAHIHRETANIPAWEGAVPGAPQVHYDLGGQVAAYVFSVEKQGADVGYITVSGRALPNPVLEFSTAPARHKMAEAVMRSAPGIRGLPVDESKPLYLGMLAYFYRVDDPSGPRLMEMGTMQSYPLSVDNWLVPDVPDRDLAPQCVPKRVLPAVPVTLETTASTTLIKLLYGPDYRWYRGCGPTAVANAMGYWADRGYPQLMAGGSSGEYRAAIDLLADLMGTSPEGWTWLPIDDDIRKFADWKGYAFGSRETRMPSYEAYVSEIDARRPLVILVNGHVEYGNHFITGFGYAYDPADPNYRYMIVHDTWGSTPENYWVQYGTGYDRIWFDTVEPPSIQVDTTPPSSAVQPMSAPRPSPVFMVHWSGIDVGWGLQWYDVQYKVGLTGEWTDWITQTVATGAEFWGTRGQTYCFRCRAMDIDHNQEAYPEGDGDTCTAVLPRLGISAACGRPGSAFLVTGDGYEPHSTATVTVNGLVLGTVPVNEGGTVQFTLTTDEADTGAYAIQVRGPLEALLLLRLDPAAPYYYFSGGDGVFAIPGGIALDQFTYLPMMSMKSLPIAASAW